MKPVTPGIGIGIGGMDGQVYVCVVLILDYVSYVSEARGCVIGKINLNFVSFILQLGDLDLLRLDKHPFRSRC